MVYFRMNFSKGVDELTQLRLPIAARLQLQIIADFFTIDQIWKNVYC